MNDSDEDADAEKRLQQRMEASGSTTPPNAALLAPAALYLTAILEYVPSFCCLGWQACSCTLKLPLELLFPVCAWNLWRRDAPRSGFRLGGAAHSPREHSVSSCWRKCSLAIECDELCYLPRTLFYEEIESWVHAYALGRHQPDTAWCTDSGLVLSHSLNLW